MIASPRFGPYELVQRLGSGGMAETYLAVRRGPGNFEQHVCVKRILPAYEADPEFVRQFMDEARLAAQLRHGNITQVVDFGVADGSHYLALELVDGMDLRTLLNRLRDRGRNLAPPLTVFAATELAAALELAHTPGRGRLPVIHRDISPSNVLLSRAGEVYLTDFGIARAIGTKRRTESGVVRGKVPYMAAEYALQGHYDARTDLFSLGVVLYEALAGRRPFEGATELDTLQRIKAGVHAPLAQVCPEVPPLVADIVERLLQPDPGQRFQSAAALLEALAHVAPPPTVSRQLGELVRSLGESLSKSFSRPVEAPSGRTSALGAPSTPAPYPAVEPARADAATRTSDAGRGPSPRSLAGGGIGEGAGLAFEKTQPAPKWRHPAQAVAAPPAPLAETRAMHEAVAAPPPSHAELEPARGAGVWVLVAILALGAFGAAVAAAYFLVEYIHHAP